MSATRPCKRCDCPLIFATNTTTAKVVPLDTRAEVYRVKQLAGRDVAERVRADERIYVSHFRTCPHASEFSAGKK